ncbi:MAG: ComEC/Rec2 family competence protein [Sedimentisphaerales bacterium]|nr:ComEC/Rec2 family competence protein [Sedimentisphaerales bacterium]
MQKVGFLSEAGGSYFARPAPLFPVALAVVLGIVLARYEIVHPAAWIVLLAAAVLTGIAMLLLAASGPKTAAAGSPWRRGGWRESLLRRDWLLKGALLAGFVGLGAARYNQVYYFYPGCHLVQYSRSEPRLVHLEGVVLTEPRTEQAAGRDRELDFIYPPSTIFTLDARRIQTSGGWLATTGRVLLVVRDDCPVLTPNQTVRLSGWLSQRSGPWNPGQRDRRIWHRAARTLLLCRVNQGQAVEPMGPAAGRWPGFDSLRRQLAGLARSAVLDDIDGFQGDQRGAVETAFLEALLLGRRENLSRGDTELFLRSGTLHYLSLSGFHVGLLAGMLWLLGRILRLGRTRQGLLILAGVSCYVLAVPARAPVLRAGLLCGVFALAHLSRRRADGLNLLSLAAGAILLWRPLDLFAAGFQLSFVVVLALLLFSGPILRRQFFSGQDDWLSRQRELVQLDSQELSGRRLLLCGGGRWLAGLVVVAAVAWLAGLPLAAHHFHRIAPWGILASVLLFPLLGLTMLLGLVKLLLGLLFPTLSLWVGALMLAIARLSLGLVEVLGRLPFGTINNAAVPLGMLVSFYGLLFWGGRSLRRGRAIGRGCLAGLLVWAIIWVWQLPYSPARGDPAEIRIHVLSVGQGCATVIELPDGKTCCYDVGSMSMTEVGWEPVSTFLRSRGIQRLEAIFLSHPNLDHVSGALDVCRSVPVGAIYHSDQYLSAGGPYCRQVLQRLGELGITLRPIHRGCRLTNPQSPVPYRIEVLWPPPDSAGRALSSNDGSLVLRIGSANGSILLCGDIGPIPQRYLLESQTITSSSSSAGRLQADVLLLPHHGSPVACLGEFVREVDPRVCLNSCGTLPEGTRRRLESMLGDYPLFNTAGSGAVRAAIGSQSITVRTFRSPGEIDLPLRLRPRAGP